MYCANAGVAPHGGPDAGEAAWARAWEVNVMAHIRAAGLLLPSWLGRGRGRFLATVSAAGMLTMLGSAPYSVTKHAALAFAEWLSATYRHRGITVQALCPQGVRTAMLADAGPGALFLMDATAIEPGQVAEIVTEALADDRFLDPAAPGDSGLLPCQGRRHRRVAHEHEQAAAQGRDDVRRPSQRPNSFAALSWQTARSHSVPRPAPSRASSASA